MIQNVVCLCLIFYKIVSQFLLILQIQGQPRPFRSLQSQSIKTHRSSQHLLNAHWMSTIKELNIQFYLRLFVYFHVCVVCTYVHNCLHASTYVCTCMSGSPWLLLGVTFHYTSTILIEVGSISQFQSYQYD